MRKSNKKAKTVEDGEGSPAANKQKKASSSKRGKAGAPTAVSSRQGPRAVWGAAVAPAAGAPANIASWPGSQAYSVDRVPAHVNKDGTIPTKCSPAMQRIVAGNNATPNRHMGPAGQAPAGLPQSPAMTNTQLQWQLMQAQNAAGQSPAGSPLSPALNSALLQWQLMQAHDAAGHQAEPLAAGVQGGLAGNYMQQQASWLSPSLQGVYGSPLMGISSPQLVLAGMSAANMMNNGYLQLQQIHLQQMQAQHAAGHLIGPQAAGGQVGVATSPAGMQHVIQQQASWLSPRIQASSNGLIAAPPYGGLLLEYAADGTLLQTQPPAAYYQAPKFLPALHGPRRAAAATGVKAETHPLPASGVPAIGYPAAALQTSGPQDAGRNTIGLSAAPASPLSEATTMIPPPELQDQQQLSEDLGGNGVLFGKEDSFWDIVGRELEDSFDFSAWEELLSSGNTPADDTPAATASDVDEELQGLLDLI